MSVHTMSRVALQFVGLVRGFRFEKTRHIIYSRLVKPLEEQGYAVDVFWHTYDVEYDDVIMDLSKDQFNVIDVVVDSDQELQDYLENDYRLMDKYNFYPHWSKDHKYGWFKYQNSIKQVTLLRNKYEKENNVEYQWVINTSPQMEPQCDIDDLTVLDNRFLYSPGYARFGGYYVSFFLGNSSHLDYIATCYDYMINKEFKTDSNRDFRCFKEELIDSEPIFKQFVDCKYEMRDTLDVRFNRLRFNGTRVDH